MQFRSSQDKTERLLNDKSVFKPSLKDSGTVRTKERVERKSTVDLIKQRKGLQIGVMENSCADSCKVNLTQGPPEEHETDRNPCIT